MTFDEILTQVLDLLQRERRVSYGRSSAAAWMTTTSPT